MMSSVRSEIALANAQELLQVCNAQSVSCRTIFIVFLTENKRKMLPQVRHKTFDIIVELRTGKSLIY